MARRIRAKLVMELREQGASRRSIASSRHMSMDSVCEVFDMAAKRQITWERVKDMPEDEVYHLFYPDRHVRDAIFEEPDWDYVHKEMAKVGVNMRLLHDEYKSACARTHKVATGYTKFCEGYGDHVTANSLTKRIEHKAVVSCEVGWSLSACVSSSGFFVNHHPILSGLSTKVFRISPRAAGPTLPSCFPA